jgi:hypothetical protein
VIFRTAGPVEASDKVLGSSETTGRSEVRRGVVRGTGVDLLKPPTDRVEHRFNALCLTPQSHISRLVARAEPAGGLAQDRLEELAQDRIE